MNPRLRNPIGCLAIACAIVSTAGCSNASGYTQTPEELTPRLDIIAGDNQSTQVHAPFPTAMKVHFHKNGMSLGGHPVTFSAPGTGAGGTFPDGSTNATVVTDDGGNAVAPTFTANGTAGSYTILAWSANYQVTFHLTNQ
ncbi:MAG: hypothetical protein LWW79_10790 [Holophagaceae bacterium]|nr:hypothetical protein [Holophagaceae bacterium]